MSDTPPRPRGTRFPTLGALAVDGAIVCGAGLITYGVSLINQPAAFIVAGCFLLGGGWLFASRGNPE